MAHTRFCIICNKVIRKPLKHLKKYHTEVYQQHLLAKTNFFIHFRNPTLIELNKGFNSVPKSIEISEINEFNFIWEDIIFKNRQVEIYIKRLSKRFHPISCKKSVESLNKIKEDFFLKHDGHQLYKMKTEKNIILLEQSKDIKNILSLIDSAVEYYNFKFEKTKRVRFLSDDFLKNLVNDKILSVFDYDINKAPYIKFLYSLHESEFKIIPILEVIGSAKEESFLFRLTDSKDNIVVLWENLNQGRATYVFKLRKRNNLNSILSYISEDEPSKRLYLKKEINQEWASKTLGYIGYVEHEELDAYKSEIRQLLSLS